MKFRIVILLSLLISSCSLYNLQTIEDKFEFKNVLSDTTKSYIYRANLSLYDNDFSGMIIIKPQANNNRIVFINEIGMKFFDFEFTKDDYKINYIFKPMNKKMFIKLLINDFRFILMNNMKYANTFYKQKNGELYVVKPKNEKELYFFYKDNLFPTKAIKYSTFRKNTFLIYDNYINKVPQEISIKHRNIKFEMKMSFVK